MAEEKRKPTRNVREYLRRGYPVRGYEQQYDKPRGERNPRLNVDPRKKKSMTKWLKGPGGKFIGRANSQGKANVKKRIVRSGYDGTRSIRERGKYGRIYGRSSGY